MAITSLPEHTVQQPGRAEQADVARMERRDRSSILHLFSRQEKGRDLPPRGGRENDVLDLVQWQATIDKRRGSRGWHTVGCLGAGQNWHWASPQYFHQQCAIAVVVLAAHALPHTEQGHLIEPLCLWIGEPEDAQVAEIACQQRDRGISRSCGTTISRTPPSASQRNVCSRKRYSIRLLSADPISESYGGFR
jgi:hypothetical protein